MMVRSPLLEDSIRDFGQEQDILAIGHRIANVRMTDAWRSFLLSCIGNQGPLDAAWRVVVEECLRYLVNARALTGQGLTISEVAAWVASLADRHAFIDISQQMTEVLARDIVVVGLMASGEEVLSYTMRDGRLERTHAPAIVEERQAGMYQPTLETMDYAFRNLDYERAYAHAFHAKDVMLKRQIESGNYDDAARQVRSLRMIVAMIRVSYQKMMDGVMSDMTAEEMRRERSLLAENMESISRNNDLDRIADKLDRLSHTSFDSSRNAGLASARQTLSDLMAKVRAAREDIHDMLSLRARAEARLDERLARGMTIRSHGRTVNLSSLMGAAACGRIAIGSLVDLLLVSSSAPEAMRSVSGWGTLLVSANERETGPRGGGLDLSELSDVMDERKARVERVKASMGSSLEALLANPHASEEGVEISSWLVSVSDEDLYEWLDTGVLVAFVHALHAGGNGAGSAGAGTGWRDWIDERFNDVELALSCGKGEPLVVDAAPKDGRAPWELRFEGRRIKVVK
ncbi:MAG: hypothetical protein Q4B54_09365 [Coriobacteriales bacterium]|nr:hypothetical protein [Coriobacteriales bacterium]